MAKTKHEFRKEIIDLGFKITDESTGELLNDDTPQPPLTQSSYGQIWEIETDCLIYISGFLSSFKTFPMSTIKRLKAWKIWPILMKRLDIA